MLGAVCDPIFDDAQCPTELPHGGERCPLLGLQCSWCQGETTITFWCDDSTPDAAVWLAPGSCVEEK